MQGPETTRVPPTAPDGASTARAPAASHDAAYEGGSTKSFSSSVVDNLTAWWDDNRRIAHDRLELATLEIQRASESLITIAISAFVALLLVTATWLGLMAALTLGLIGLGLAAGWSILIVSVINLIGAFICLKIIKGKTPYLKFPATVASLKPGFRPVGEEEV